MPDHFPLFVDIRMSLEKIDKEKSEKKIYNYKKLANIASTINWSRYAKYDPNEAINLVTQEIQNCLKKSEIVMTNKGKKRKNLPRKTWITKSIVKSCGKKEALYKHLKLDPFNVNLRNKYKNYVKILNRIIKDAKINYEKKNIEQNIENSRKLWEIINAKMGKNRYNDNDISEIKMSSNEIIRDKKKIADMMNSYYCTMGKEMSKNIIIPKNKTINLPQMSANSIFIKPTTKSEVLKIIDNLKNKNGGIDKISAKSIKIISSLISDSLASIFNNCIDKSMA